MRHFEPPPGGKVEVFRSCKLLECGWDEAIDLVAPDTPGRESSVARRNGGNYPDFQRILLKQFDLVLVRGGSIGLNLVDLCHMKLWGLSNRLLDASPIEILSGLVKPQSLSRLGRPLISVVCPRHVRMASLSYPAFCLSRNRRGTQVQHVRNVFLGKSSINWAAFVTPSE